MFERPAIITGLGLCTPLGATAEETWRALRAGRFITDHSRAVGEYSSPRVCALALAAVRQALAESGWNDRQIQEAGLVVGTSKGPIEEWLRGPSEVLTRGLSEVAAVVAAGIGLGLGPRITISTACASGIHALIRGVMMLDEGVERVIVAAAESSLHPLFLSSFKRLGVLAASGEACRPFDENRSGFLVSEAGAAVCLSREGIGLRVTRFAMAGDAVHLTGGDPSGATLRRVLGAMLAGGVDFIHAHGTGTVFNDPVELGAIEAALPDGSSVPVYSHKGALGHSLGAAGLVAVILNCLVHRDGVIPPGRSTTRPLSMKQVFWTPEEMRQGVRRSVLVASGFGGAAGGVRIESPM